MSKIEGPGTFLVEKIRTLAGFVGEKWGSLGGSEGKMGVLWGSVDQKNRCLGKQGARKATSKTDRKVSRAAAA